MIGTLTRRSMRARAGRSIFIGLAIMLGVSFVAGSFVLADSLKATFDNLFSELNQDVDFEVRTELTVDSNQALRDPVPADLVARARSRSTASPRSRAVCSVTPRLLDKQGEAVGTQGAPAIGVSWSGPDGGFSGVELKDGRAPVGIGETAIDKATADRVGYRVGDRISIVFDSGQRQFTDRRPGGPRATPTGSVAPAIVAVRPVRPHRPCSTRRTNST